MIARLDRRDEMKRKKVSPLIPVIPGVSGSSMNMGCDAEAGIGDAAEHASTQAPGPDGPPPGKWRRPMTIGAIALTLPVIVSAAIFALARGEDGESQVRDLVQRFATSVEVNPFEAAAMLCQEEREIFEQNANPDIDLPEAPLKPKVSVSAVVVQGDVASAMVKPPVGPSRRMYFRKEKGLWTVCAPAAPSAQPAIGGGS